MINVRVGKAQLLFLPFFVVGIDLNYVNHTIPGSVIQLTNPLI
jgi:hypothetical protein